MGRIGPWLVLSGGVLVAAGIVLGHSHAPTTEWRDLRFDREETASAPGAVVNVTETAYRMPPKIEGLLPLPVYRVEYRYGLPDGRNFDGASHSTGLFHRVRDTVTVQYIVADPAVSRAHRTTLAPRGPLGLLSLALPIVGAALLLAGIAGLRSASRGRTATLAVTGAVLVPLLASAWRWLLTP